MYSSFPVVGGGQGTESIIRRLRTKYPKGGLFQDLLLAS
jgi:hypothetical protein